MEQALTVVIPLIAFTIINLIICYKSFSYRRKTKSPGKTAFFAVSLTSSILMICTTISYSMELGLIPITSVATYLLCGVAIECMTATSCFWLAYLMLLIRNGRPMSKNISIIISIPTLLLLFMIIASPWTHWIFYVTQDGIYHEGTLFALQFILPYSYMMMALIMAVVLVIRGHGKTTTRLVRNFIFFLIPSVVGAVVQIKLYRAGYSQIGLSLSVLLMYFEQFVEEINENEQLRKNMEINDKLSERMSIIQSMSKIYFTSFFVNLTDNTFIEISNMDFVRDRVGTKGNAQAALYYVADNMVEGETAEVLREFVNLSTINERLSEKQFVTCDYLGKVAGWCQMYIIAGDKEENGTLKNVFVATRTIHDEKTRELEMKRTLEAARDLAQAQKDELEVAKKAADAANDAKTAFLFNMSHDIRTPMNAIIGFRDLLEKHQDDPQKRADYLRKIEEADKVLLSILNNVLEMARIENGTIEMNETAWNVDQFNDSFYSIFAEMMKEKNIEFKSIVNVQNHYVFCDATKLREVFINMLSNAFKYTPDGGKVTMVLEELPYDREGWTLFKASVIDNGIGMSEEFIPHIFEEFSREKNTTDTKIEGTGLGMPIVKRLVEFMNGTIEVSSKKGEGTTVSVIIPHRIAPKDMVPNHKASNLDSEKFKGMHILLAEDNEINAEIATEILSESGFIVDVACDGQVCVELLKNAKSDYYNLILMDVQMPNMNGYEATTVIRKMEDKKKAGIPILAMTANAFEEDKRAAQNAGMNGHISKPIDINAMLKEISAALGK